MSDKGATVTLKPETVFGEFADLQRWIDRRLDANWDRPLIEDRTLTDSEHRWMLLVAGLDATLADRQKANNTCRDIDGDRVTLQAQRWLGRALPPNQWRRQRLKAFFLEAVVTVTEDSWGYLTVHAQPRFGTIQSVTLAINPAETGNGIPLWVAMARLTHQALAELEAKRDNLIPFNRELRREFERDMRRGRAN